MSKREWFGLVVLGLGSLFGFILGGMFGLGLAAICLVIGLVLLVASVATGAPTSSSPSGASSPTGLIVLVKEVHARPQRDGKFQEIHDPDQADLQFEVFVHCWLVNDTDHRFGLPRIEVSLTKPDGVNDVLPQVHGDLHNWSLGRLRDELDTWGVRYLQAAHETMQELNVTDPLEGGATRQGWLHVHTENFTPGQLRTSSIRVTVFDSAGQTHIGTANGPHHVPGRIWPLSSSPAAAPESSAETSNQSMQGS